MDTKDNVVHSTAWGERSPSPDPFADIVAAETPEDAAVRPAPRSAAQSLADEAGDAEGAFAHRPEYDGAFGRTLFDARSSEDGTVTVVFPADQLGNIPSQALIRIISVPDGRRYIAAVASGPFCEPDGLSADAPQLIVTAVRGHYTLPRHHGRLQATIIGESTPKGIIPASHRPRPNSAVHLGHVDIQRRARTMLTALIIALKLVSVLS